MPGAQKTGEELVDEAIDIVSNKLRQVNQSLHIVALSQELRALIQLRKEIGRGK